MTIYILGTLSFPNYAYTTSQVISQKTHARKYEMGVYEPFLKVKKSRDHRYFRCW